MKGIYVCARAFVHLCVCACVKEHQALEVKYSKNDHKMYIKILLVISGLNLKRLIRYLGCCCLHVYRIFVFETYVSELSCTNGERICWGLHSPECSSKYSNSAAKWQIWIGNPEVALGHYFLMTSEEAFPVLFCALHNIIQLRTHAYHTNHWWLHWYFSRWEFLQVEFTSFGIKVRWGYIFLSIICLPQGRMLDCWECWNIIVPSPTRNIPYFMIYQT